MKFSPLFMKQIFIFISLAFVLPATGQETPKIEVRTLCFERDPSGIDKLAVVTPDKSIVEVGFPESFPSAKVRVPLVEGKVIFFNPANLTGPPVAIAKIPAGLKIALVMFFPSAGVEKDLAYNAVVTDASLEGIPEDGALVMNIFPQDVRVVVGEHRVLLKAGKSTGLTRPSKRNDYNMAAVVFQAQEETEWITVAETLVRFPPEQQQLFISYPDSRTQRLAFRAYQLDKF